MESDLSPEDPDPMQVARTRPCWRLTMELQPDMVLAKEVTASYGGYATLQLSAGVALTEETIAQLVVKGIECVAVLNTDPPGAGDYALLQQTYEARLRQVFEPTPNAACQALLTALLLRGPMPC
jgi:hypothetical protein